MISSSCTTTTAGSSRRAQITDYRAGVRLHLHPGKTAIVPVRAGLTFVGFRTWPGRREVRGANIRLFFQRLRRWRKQVEAGECTYEEVRQHIVGWLGHAMQGDPERLLARLRNRWPWSIKDS